MSKTMSVRVTERQLALLGSLSRRWRQRSVGSTLSLLLEEKLREEEFNHIVFRDTAAGREAFIDGTGLAAWEIVMIVRAHEGDMQRAADHLDIPIALVQAAVSYRESYPDEIEAALAENDSYTLERLRRHLPEIEHVAVEG